jgi:hypothetical protein
MSLPKYFYLYALRELTNLDGYKIFLVTENMANASARLLGIKNKLIISECRILNFQLLMHSDKLIKSDSSFALVGRLPK